MKVNTMSGHYVGRIAPTPTGFLHRGHARTFTTAWHRAREAGGKLIYRDEDLDPHRCQQPFASAAMEDLSWLGIDWDEGPDIGGPHAPYRQSQRTDQYLAAWQNLKNAGLIYPTLRSRRELREAVAAGDTQFTPANEDEQDSEPIFPTRWRDELSTKPNDPGHFNWRFRAPDGETISFTDRNTGPQHFTVGEDLGDFLVWRRDGVPAYELAVVVDDIAMGVTEVVRGADLLRSTARQLLLYRAFNAPPPGFFHCELVRDKHGQRLAKRSASDSLRALRHRGVKPAAIRAEARGRGAGIELPPAAATTPPNSPEQPDAPH